MPGAGDDEATQRLRTLDQDTWLNSKPDWMSEGETYADFTCTLLNLGGDYQVRAPPCTLYSTVRTLRRVLLIPHLLTTNPSRPTDRLSDPLPPPPTGSSKRRRRPLSRMRYAYLALDSLQPAARAPPHVVASRPFPTC